MTRILARLLPSSPSAPSARPGDGVEDVAAEELGGGQLALELRQSVEVLIGERLQRLVEHVERRADIDHHVLLVSVAEEGDVDHEGGAVHVLRRPEERIGQAVGDHDAVADFDGIHGEVSWLIRLSRSG